MGYTSIMLDRVTIEDRTRGEKSGRPWLVISLQICMMPGQREVIVFGGV